MSDQHPNALVTQCAICCNEGGFAKFLAECYPDAWEATPEPQLGERNRATRTIYRVLGIKSRTELRTNPEKAEAWRSLHSGYEFWIADV